MHFTKNPPLNSFNALRATTAAVLLAAAILPSPAAEEDGKFNQPWEKGSLRFGGFISAFDSTVTFGVNSAGVTVNAEELLGLDDSLTVFRVDALYRPGQSRRHQIDFTYASYNRDGTATLDQEITIRGTTYPIGARIQSELNFDIIRGTYSYALIQDDRMRIALGLGIYGVPLEYGLEVDTSGGRSTVEGADTTLPLPAIAFRGEFMLIPKLFLYASIDAMYLEVSDFKGSLLDVNVGLEYRPWKHVGFGLGYNSMSVSVEGEGDSDYPGVDFVGDVDIRFNGLLLYGKLSF
jgi:hypothetical protein